MCGLKWELSQKIYPNCEHRELVYDDSARPGCDVRDLKIAGCSDDEINPVPFGRNRLEQLLRRKPGAAS